MHPRPLQTPARPRPPRRKARLFGLLMVVTAVAYGAVILSQPFSVIMPADADNTLSITTPTGQLPWPGYGQAAYGLSNGKVIATHGDQTAVPIASITKVITALVVLRKHPLAAGQSGPVITLTDKDVAIYDQYLAVHGSVVPVAAGQKLTERQILQAMLLPSANNLSDSLAIWAYGSLDSYFSAARAYLAAQHLDHTHVATDASGLSPDTTSTASDLVVLGSLAMRDVSLAQIVSEKTAVIPGVGLVSNYNSLLGSNNVAGIKTGNNDQNKGVFLGAANKTIAGRKVTVITAVSGADSLGQALGDSAGLLAAVQSSFTTATVISDGAVLGSYKLANNQTLQAVAAGDLTTTVLRGETVKASISLQNINYKTAAGQRVGSVTSAATDYAPAKQIAVILQQKPVKPSIGYRLLHPFNH